MSITATTAAPTQRERLIELAVWAGGEQVRKDLGLPSEWNQKSWMARSDCGTTCCIAGKVALDEGAIPVVYDDYGCVIEDPAEALNRWATEDYEGEEAVQVQVPGTDFAVCIEAYAQEVLGLDDRQAFKLFYGDNTLSDVIRVVRELLDELPA